MRELVRYSIAKSPLHLLKVVEGVCSDLEEILRRNLISLQRGNGAFPYRLRPVERDSVLYTAYALPHILKLGERYGRALEYIMLSRLPNGLLYEEVPFIENVSYVNNCLKVVSLVTIPLLELGGAAKRLCNEFLNILANYRSLEGWFSSVEKPDLELTLYASLAFLSAGDVDVARSAVRYVAVWKGTKRFAKLRCLYKFVHALAYGENPINAVKTCLGSDGGFSPSGGKSSDLHTLVLLHMSRRFFSPEDVYRYCSKVMKVVKFCEESYDKVIKYLDESVRYACGGSTELLCIYTFTKLYVLQQKGVVKDAYTATQTVLDAVEKGSSVRGVAEGIVGRTLLSRVVQSVKLFREFLASCNARNLYDFVMEHVDYVVNKVAKYAKSSKKLKILGQLHREVSLAKSPTTELLYKLLRDSLLVYPYATAADTTLFILLASRTSEIFKALENVVEAPPTPNVIRALASLDLTPRKLSSLLRNEDYALDIVEGMSITLFGFGTRTPLLLALDAVGDACMRRCVSVVFGGSCPLKDVCTLKES